MTLKDYAKAHAGNIACISPVCHDEDGNIKKDENGKTIRCAAICFGDPNGNLREQNMVFLTEAAMSFVNLSVSTWSTQGINHVKELADGRVFTTENGSECLDAPVKVLKTTDIFGD